MSNFEDLTVEITVDGVTVRVAKEEAHLYEKKVKEVKPKDTK